MNSLPHPATQRVCMSGARKIYTYLRRILKFDQMDFEFAFWQMLYLFIAPQKVYKNFQYRKKNKFQYARDDPAFLVLFTACLCITSIGFAIVLKLGILQSITFLLYTVFIDCIATGLLVATIFWFILNKNFRNINEIQDVEWAYAFDVHLNAFFPPLMLLHFFQLFFYNGLINHEWFISTLVGNTFWLVAVLYYLYITFLGYNSLQFLKDTHLLITPVPFVVAFYIVSIISSFNITRMLMHFYKHRVVS